MADPLSVPAANPLADYLARKQDIDQAVQRVLAAGQYILGPEVNAFQQEFAAFLGVRCVAGVGSGTEALHLALRACDVGPGDAVITVSHTAVATVAAIELAGATPILVDIDPRTYTLSPQRLEEAIRAHRALRIKVVIPVHLYGHPAEMPVIMSLAEQYGFKVIEDCAQAHGAMIGERKLGTWGHMAAFSFYPTKNLGGVGDGGAVATNDPELGARVLLLREYGWRQRYISDLPGTNSRLDELQAAILRVKLRFLDNDNAQRREIALRYDTMLSGCQIELPYCRSGVTHVYHQYVIRTTERDALRSYLAMQSVGTLIHYPVPVHQQPAYAGRLIGGRDLTETERACREIISLPMHPHLSIDQVRRVGDSILSWLKPDRLPR